MTPQHDARSLLRSAVYVVAAAAQLAASLMRWPASVTNPACHTTVRCRLSKSARQIESNFGDDPADAEDLANCIQNARENYGSCLDDCARLMLLSSLGRASANSQCEAAQRLLNTSSLVVSFPRTSR